MLQEWDLIDILDDDEDDDFIGEIILSLFRFILHGDYSC